MDQFFSSKTASDVLDYGFYFSLWMPIGDLISASTTITATPSGLTIGSPTISGMTVSAMVSGGTTGTLNYVVANLITTSGRTATCGGFLMVADQL